jgi:uncharacterized membrane protein YkvA (DUF1232 family)
MRFALARRALALRADVLALYFAARDPRVPWYAKAVAIAVVAYAASPVDLVPDFIPLLGYLDDVVIVPAGVLLVRRLVPASILEEHRARASQRLVQMRRLAWVGGAMVLVLWFAALGALAWLFVGALG